MKTQFIELANEGVSLTAYILDSSPELSNWEKRPAVLVIPGGAYKFCSDREAEPIAMAFCARGYNAFVLRYSIGEGKAAFPRPLDDAKQALSMIREKADEWNIEVDKIAAIGFSAGGHLCAALSAMSDIKPNASILCYPCILESMSAILAEPVPSVDAYVDANTPPTFIVSSREDGAVPIENSLRYADALEKAGVDFEMHIYAKGHHGFSLANSVVYSHMDALEYNKHLSGWFDICMTWLNKTFNIK